MQGVEIATEASVDSQTHIYCNCRHFYVVLCSAEVHRPALLLFLSLAVSSFTHYALIHYQPITSN